MESTCTRQYKGTNKESTCTRSARARTAERIFKSELSALEVKEQCCRPYRQVMASTCFTAVASANQVLLYH
jgi:hypothetical protein